MAAIFESRCDCTVQVDLLGINSKLWVLSRGFVGMMR